MDIQTRFSLGDLVYHVREYRGENICPSCTSTRQLFGHDQKPVPCPTCNAKGIIVNVGWIVEEERLVVEEVRITVASGPCKGLSRTTIQYVCDGILFESKDLFANEGGAQSVRDIRNDLIT